MSKAEFIKNVISNNWTIAETCNIIKSEHISDTEISNITFNDFLNYNGEIILNVPESTIIHTYCAIIINTYKTNTLKSCDSNSTRNNQTTLTNIISYYIKNIKFQKLEEESKKTYLNSKSINEHVSDYENKINNCKSAKELIMVLNEGNFSPYILHSWNINGEYHENINFLDLHEKEDADEEYIDEKRKEILERLNFEIEVENNFSQLEGDNIIIFEFKNHNITLGAVGDLDSSNELTNCEGFIEIKHIEKTMMVWEPI